MFRQIELTAVYLSTWLGIGQSIYIIVSCNVLRTSGTYKQHIEHKYNFVYNLTQLRKIQYSVENMKLMKNFLSQYIQTYCTRCKVT